MSAAGVVLVGASLAGAHAALALRRLDYDAPVTLVGAEPHLPYERPELSKGFLAGEIALDKLLVAPHDSYREAAIDLRLGVPASGLDTDRRRVQLADGSSVPYDAVVLATGSANVRPRIEGIDLPGVFQLRTLDEASALAAAATAGAAAVVVGMGLVGCEVAATLRTLGLAVTAVDALPGPLWAVLGPELSAMVRGWHTERGVSVLGDVAVAALEGDGRVERVRLADGRLLDADLVVVGVGARPALEWLGAASLHRAGGGLAVDAELRSSVPDVYAAGDVAAVWDAGAGEHRRTEHYTSAVDQGRRVAHSIVGAELPATSSNWFWSQQYDHYLQYAGAHTCADELVVRDAPYAAFFLRDSALQAVATVDNGRDLRRALRLLGRTVDPAMLADPAADLRKLG